MKFKTIFHVFLFFLLFFLSCTLDKEKEKPKVVELPSPASDSGEPNFFFTENGQVYLSWIKHKADTSFALQFAELKNKKWTKTKEIAAGKDWFVNWADFPSLAVKDGGQLMAAHWLQKRAAGTYDYDIHMSLSKDGGDSWSPSFLPHTDGVAAEHGFVSMFPLGNGFFAAWLDGRYTKTGEQAGHGHGHGHGGGPMTLRTAEFDASGLLGAEAELDKRVCDCCQTDAALTANGPIVVYRDRSEKEIRDIAIVRRVNGKWTTPKTVHQDNWTVEGCPVNGPSVAANGKEVAVAWFTAAQGKNAVKLAFSDDAGASFGTPVRLDSGDAIGRVATIFVQADRFFACWVEEGLAGTELRAAFVGKGGIEGETFLLSAMDKSRGSGFPVLAKTAGQVLIAFTDVEKKAVRVLALPLR